MLHPRIAIWSPVVLPATLIFLYLSFYHGPASEPPLQTQTPILPKVHLFIPINEGAARSERGFCRTMQGAVVNGWEPIIFNWDITPPYQKKKVRGLAHILSSANHTTDIQDDDLVFTMDGMDVWLQLSPDVVARRFLEYNVEILVAAEKNCFPNRPEDHDCTAAPESPMLKGLYRSDDDESRPMQPEEKAPRHANSGTVVGRAVEMKTFYSGLWEFMNSDRYDGYDDQGAFNMLLSDGYLDLDYYTRLFWPGHDDFHNMQFMGTHYPPDPSIAASTSNQPESPSYIPWDLYPPLGHHQLHGEVPVALHFNGGSKHLVVEWWGKLWWSSARERFRETVRRRMDRGRIRFVTDDGYREESIREVCPLLDIWQWDLLEETHVVVS